MPYQFKVMISAPYMLPVIDRFRPIFEENLIELIVPPVEERMEEMQLLEYVGDIDGAICGDDRFTERVLAAAPRLKVISKWGTGIDSIDAAACQKHGVAIRNTLNAFTVPVSDTVLGYMLAFARNIPFMNQAMHQGHWKKIPGRALHECTLGVIGLGNIGKAVLRKAGAFGMNLLVNDTRALASEELSTLGAKEVPLKDLLAQSDFVSIACDLNPTSYHLMNRQTLALMRPEAVLINTARGPIVHEEALVEALQNGQIAGAALDVFEHEPLPHDSPLMDMDQVLMAPHNSNSSPSAWEKVHHSTINNLLAVLLPREQTH